MRARCVPASASRMGRCLCSSRESSALAGAGRWARTSKGRTRQRARLARSGSATRIRDVRGAAGNSVGSRVTCKHKQAALKRRRDGRTGAMGLRCKKSREKRGTPCRARVVSKVGGSDRRRWARRCLERKVEACPQRPLRQCTHARHRALCYRAFLPLQLSTITRRNE